MSVRSLNNSVPLLALRDAALELGSRLIFQKANIYISRNDKTCLVGRNGSGKSTLLKALSGALELDRGDRFIKPGTVVKYLSQEPDFKYDQTAWEYVKNGLKEEEFDQPNFRIESMLSELRLDGDRKVATLSGGEARRAALAKVIISKPDILLLDEPTNHLDLHTIEWLEAELRNFKGGFLLVSHDRAFLRNLSNSMYWIDRTVVRKHEKGFDEFVDWSEKIIKDEITKNKNLDKKIAQETLWLREGLTARRKRNMGRVRQLHELGRKKLDRIKIPEQIKLVVQETTRSGKLVLEARNITKRFDSENEGQITITDRFSTLIARGERVGLIGRNGVGKTTLVRMLLGDEKPDSGKVKWGVGVEHVYFDQNRETLDKETTVWQTLCPNGGDRIEINGRSKHVAAYMRDFLFDEKQLTSRVESLSGGERNRLLLARLFSQEHNLLVLDEPTNDLDVETLEVLEEVLANYNGTVILVSHDREFLDKVATSTIAIEGDGLVEEYPGGYSTYLDQRTRVPSIVFTKRQDMKKEPPKKKMSKKGGKLSYKDQRELDDLPGRMEIMQGQIDSLTSELSISNLFQRDRKRYDIVSLELEKNVKDLKLAEQRWLELEERKLELENQ